MIIHNPDQHLVIKIGLLILLYFARSHELLRKSYESLYTNEVRVRGKAKFDYRRIITNFINGKGLREEVDLSKIVRSERGRMDNFYENDEQKVKSYARTGLTYPDPVWAVYNILSNATCCYVLIRKLIPVEWIGFWLLNRKLTAKCILPGNFVTLSDSLSDRLCIYLAISHLCWRLYQWRRRHNIRLQLIMFMIQSDKEIGRILNLHGREFSKSIDSKGSQFNEEVSADSIEENLVVKKNSIQQLTVKHDGIFQCYDDLLIYLMYYQVKYETKITYKLRPNRTSEARQQLARHIIRFYYISFLSFSLLFIAIFSAAFYIILSDIFYVQNYPGCYDYLENLYQEGKLTYLSVTLWGPKLYANLFDFYVNFCSRVDVSVAVLFVVPIAYILNYDLLFYWKRLQIRLENVLYELKLDFIMTHQSLESNLESRNERSIYYDNYCRYNYSIELRKRQSVSVSKLKSINHSYYTKRLIEYSSIFKDIRERKTSTISYRDAGELNERTSGGHHKIHHHLDYGSNNRNGIVDWARKETTNFAKSSDFSSKIQSVTNPVSAREYYLENLIIVLQAELRDFFMQIEETNRFVSDLISATYIMWFFLFLIVTYHSSMSRKDTNNFVGLRSAEAIGFAAVSIMSIVLLSLVHHTNKSYETICSIMAYDRSKYKKKFLKIIEFYTKRNCSSYTLFHSIPFLATTYLTAIAWNFSCFTIVENLLSNRN